MYTCATLLVTSNLFADQYMWSLARQVKGYPITEDMLHDGPPHFSNDAYAYAKRMMEVCSSITDACTLIICH